MDAQILWGFFLTVLPVFELRGGLPIIVEYTVRNGISIWPYFLIVLVLNILVIFLIFMFFDSLHKLLINWRFYRRATGVILTRIQKKVEKVQRRMDSWGYFALMCFVAIPVPGSGAWTGTLVAWILGLDRWKSFVAIASGVIISGLLILFLSLGFFSGFS
ncbi:MAG: small multi-drug export protein [Patescibacteria group bacterium]|nr:small multi-drug export protein [Patescibacteria group bacterium]